MKYSKANYKEFTAARNQMPTEFSVFVTPYTEAEYAEMKAITYLSKDKQSGYALVDGELISVFSLPGAKQGKQAIMDAIKRGANRLDCIDGFLLTFYKAFGFVEYQRLAWDDQYAPENWDYGQHGRPDIVFMKLS